MTKKAVDYFLAYVYHYFPWMKPEEVVRFGTLDGRILAETTKGKYVSEENILWRDAQTGHRVGVGKEAWLEDEYLAYKWRTRNYPK